MCSISMLGFIILMELEARGAVVPAVLHETTAVTASAVAILSVISTRSSFSSSLVAAASAASTACSTCVAIIKEFPFEFVDV